MIKNNSGIRPIWIRWIMSYKVFSRQRNFARWTLWTDLVKAWNEIYKNMEPTISFSIYAQFACLSKILTFSSMSLCVFCFLRIKFDYKPFSSKVSELLSTLHKTIYRISQLIIHIDCKYSWLIKTKWTFRWIFDVSINKITYLETY